MRVFITGGTGLVGTRLIEHLQRRGDKAVVLSRRANAAADLGSEVEVVQGDPTKPGPWQNRAAECDALINLAGEGIVSKRWSSEFKKLLRDSRVQGTENCAAAISRSPRREDGTPKVLVNASAIGIYGPHGAEPVDESSPPGSDFLSDLCVDWEKAAMPATSAGARLVLARIGIVLDRKGGALSKLLLPFKLGMGGPIASGKQYMAWIHLDDVAGMLLFALDSPSASGPMNVTAPTPVTNKEFGKALGRAIGRPAFMWTPGFMLKLLMGQGAEIVITGANVLPKKAPQWGYQFKFPQLDAALADILK